MINFDKQVSKTIVELVELSDITLNLTLPYTMLLKTKGKVLQTDHNSHPKLQVYTRNRFHKFTIVPIVPLVEVQSNLPSECPTTHSNPSSTHISSLYNDLPNLSSSNLDLPIALRKGTQASTKHLIAKYLSYEKLSYS